MAQNMEQLFEKRKEALRKFQTYYEFFLQCRRKEIIAHRNEIDALIKEIDSLNDQLADDDTHRYYQDKVVEEFIYQSCRVQRYSYSGKRHIARTPSPRNSPRKRELRPDGGGPEPDLKIGRNPEKIAKINCTCNSISGFLHKLDLMETYIVKADYPVQQKIIDLANTSGALKPYLLNVMKNQRNQSDPVGIAFHILNEKFNLFNQHPITEKLISFEPRIANVLSIANLIQRLNDPFLKFFMTRILYGRLPSRLTDGVKPDDIKSLIASLRKSSRLSKSLVFINQNYHSGHEADTSGVAVADISASDQQVGQKNGKEDLDGLFHRLIENKSCPICYTALQNIDGGGKRKRLPKHPILACRRIGLNSLTLKQTLSELNINKQTSKIRRPFGKNEPEIFDSNVVFTNSNLSKKWLSTCEFLNFNWTLKFIPENESIVCSMKKLIPIYVMVDDHSDCIRSAEATVALEFYRSYIHEDKVRSLGLKCSPLEMEKPVDGWPLIEMATIRLNIVIGWICQPVDFHVVRYKPGIKQDQLPPLVILARSVLHKFSIHPFEYEEVGVGLRQTFKEAYHLDSDGRTITPVAGSSARAMFNGDDQQPEQNQDDNLFVEINVGQNDVLTIAVQPFRTEKTPLDLLLDNGLLVKQEKSSEDDYLEPIYVAIFGENISPMMEQRYYIDHHKNTIRWLSAEQTIGDRPTVVAIRLVAGNGAAATKLFKIDQFDVYYFLCPEHIPELESVL